MPVISIADIERQASEAIREWLRPKASHELRIKLIYPDPDGRYRGRRFKQGTTGLLGPDGEPLSPEEEIVKLSILQMWLDLPHREI